LKSKFSFKLKCSILATCLSISVFLVLSSMYNLFPAPDVNAQSFAANMTSMINNGNVLASKGDYNGAIALYNKVLEKDPNNVKALYSKGKALSVLANYSPTLFNSAIASYDKVLSLDPNNIGALYNRGNAFAKLGNYNSAIASYDKVLSLDPNNSGALYGKANALAKLGNYNAALSLYNKMLSVNATDTKALKSKTDITAKLNKQKGPVASTPPLRNTPTNSPIK
jgi:tetratricopeptide (TPR) repeat protein